MAAGLDPALFWEITPREMLLVMAGATDRQAREREEARRLTYAAGVLAREAYHAKRFPKYDQVFPAPRPRRRQAQSPAEIMDIMRQWSRTIEAAER